MRKDFSWLISLGCLAVVPSTATAQYAPPLVPKLRTETAKQERLFSGQFYPVALFIVTDRAGIFSRNGFLFSAEATVIPKPNRPQAYGAGTWFWIGHNSDIFEVHGKYFFDKKWGAQVGYLNSTRVSAPAVDYFALYNINPASNAPYYWTWQAGAGFFTDMSAGRTTTDITSFIQGQTTLGKDLSLSFSYWFIRNRSFFNRVALGVGKRF